MVGEVIGVLRLQNLENPLGENFGRRESGVSPVKLVASIPGKEQILVAAEHEDADQVGAVEIGWNWMCIVS